MNIFENYLDKIKIAVDQLSKKNLIILPDNLSSLNVDIPPQNIKADISTNISMILSKINKKSPMALGEIIKKKLLEDVNISKIEIVKPGFLNITLKPAIWNELIKNINVNPYQFPFYHLVNFLLPSMCVLYLALWYPFSRSHQH